MLNSLIAKDSSLKVVLDKKVKVFVEQLRNELERYLLSLFGRQMKRSKSIQELKEKYEEVQREYAQNKADLGSIKRLSLAVGEVCFVYEKSLDEEQE